jgi:general secretion pathway protein A
LEQLRLLSNLETTTDKLLQIILVGQPELGEMLDSYELRQLGQRITLSCHLFPLTYEETKEYILHRIHIASQKPAVKFSRPAVRSIYMFSGGVPRLINIACDRMLLTAFGHGRHKITGSIAGKAIRELASRGSIRRYRPRRWKTVLLVFLLFGFAFTLLLLLRPDILKRVSQTGILGNVRIERIPVEKKETVSSPQTASLKAPTASREQGTEKSQPEEKPETFGNMLTGMNWQRSRQQALMNAVSLWNTRPEISQSLNSVENDHAFFRLSAKQNGFLIYRLEGDWEAIKNLNLPAVLEFYHPIGLFPVYLTLIKMGEGQVTLMRGQDILERKVSETHSYWSGVAYVPWRNFLDLKGIIPYKSTEDSIITLKILLRGLGFDDIEVNSDYDEQTKRAIRQIQEKHGLKVDGLVGGLTKIALYNEKKSFNIPHITN